MLADLMNSDVRRAPSREEQARMVREAQADPSRFSALFEAFFDPIYRFATFHLKGDAATAADIAQDTFLRAYRALPQYRLTDRPFSAWLYRIALNLMRNLTTRRAPTVSLDRALEYAAPSTQDDERWIHLFRLAGDLPSVQREVLILRLAQGLSNDEVAEILDRTVGSIKSLYVRALRGLEKRARERGVWP
jgi:RNA polymerase sigma-70 factor (ECF subfamily)